MSASHTAGPEHSSSDDLPLSQCTLPSADPIAKRQLTRYQLAGVRTSSPSQAHNTPCPHVRRSISATYVERWRRRGAVLYVNRQYNRKRFKRLMLHQAHCSPTRAVFTAWVMFPKQLTDGTPACPDVTIK